MFVGWLTGTDGPRKRVHNMFVRNSSTSPCWMVWQESLSVCHRLFCVCVCVRGCVCVLCVCHAIVCARQHAQTWASVGHLLAFFICPQNCFCVWVYAYLVVQRGEQIFAWGERGGEMGSLVWSVGTSKPLWLADWLPGSPADWKSPKGRQTSDLITNPIMWASYSQCEQHS